MSQETLRDNSPLWEYRVPSHRMRRRGIFRLLLYLVGIVTAECSLLAISFSIFGPTFSTETSRFNCVVTFIAFGTLGGSLIYFFRMRLNTRCLPWLQYLWWILGATIGAFLAFVFEAAIVSNPNDKQLPPTVFGCIILLYSISLAVIAHLKPSLHQQIRTCVKRRERADRKKGEGKRAKPDQSKEEPYVHILL